MQINIIGQATDFRTNTPVIYAQMSIPDYLKLVSEDFDKFAIQRRREKHKAYVRMKNDIIKGGLLPSITLAVNPSRVAELLPLSKQEQLDDLAVALTVPGQVNILDGLQRTYILHDLAREGFEFKEGQKLSLEFWLEAQVQNLIYRIIVLNAGQKPMSMRHQIEVLFSTFKEIFEREIPNIELYQERDVMRRNRARKYSLERLVTAYQCFLTKSPEIQKENVVAQQIMEENILSESEEILGEQFSLFQGYLRKYADIDEDLCRIYDGSRGSSIPTGTNWFGSENVMNAFFAAMSDFGSTEQRRTRIDSALERLRAVLQGSNPGEDPLGLSVFQDVVQGFNTRKVNVGFATRKLLFQVFKEYFRDAGDTQLRDFWTREAD